MDEDGPAAALEWRLSARRGYVCKKLAYDEMVDLPLDRLLQIAYDDLHKNQAEFARVAKEIDPTKTPQQELAELATMHPAPDQLLQAFHDTLRVAGRLHSRAPHHHAAE